MKAATPTTGAAATGAGTSMSSRPSSPRSGSPIPNPTTTTMRRALLLAGALGGLGLLGGVGLMVGKGKTPAAGSRFLAQRVLVRSSTTPARRLSLPTASLTGVFRGASLLSMRTCT